MSLTRLLEELNLTWLDLFAVAFLIAAWVGYVAFAAWRRAAIPSLQGAMEGFRREWMVRMIDRDKLISRIPQRRPGGAPGGFRPGPGTGPRPGGPGGPPGFRPSP